MEPLVAALGDADLADYFFHRQNAKIQRKSSERQATTIIVQLGIIIAFLCVFMVMGFQEQARMNRLEKMVTSIDRDVGRTEINTNMIFKILNERLSYPRY